MVGNPALMWRGGVRRLRVAAPSESTRLRALLAFLLLVPLLMIYRSRPAGVQSPKSERYSLFRLRRGYDTIRMERALHNDAALGACFNDTSLVPGAPDAMCAPLHCLWSEYTRVAVDVEDEALQPAHVPDPRNTCPHASGGQRPIEGQAEPQVSFIIPFRDDPEPTARLIIEVFRSAREVESAEYILVSDGSADEALVVIAAELLRGFFGVRVLFHRLSTPQGLTSAINAGVELASGTFAAVLTPDLTVFPAWIWALVATMQQRPGAVLVGPAFADPASGALQEAGRVLYADGGHKLLGQGERIGAETGFAREVDYLSPHCLLARRAALPRGPLLDASLPGLRTQAQDLAMRVASAGGHVVYQPLSVVNRQQRVMDAEASGHDLAHTAVGLAKFGERWGAAGEGVLCAAGVEDWVAARRRQWPKVLWVDDKIPEPDRDSASVRTFNLLRILVDLGYDVTYQPLNTMVGRTAHYLPWLRFAGVHALEPNNPPFWGLRDRHGACMYDAVVVARRSIYSVAFDTLVQDCGCAPRIYDTVDLHFLREARGLLTEHEDSDEWDFNALVARHVVDWLESESRAVNGSEAVEAVLKARDKEVKLAAASKVVWVVSHVEEGVLSHYLPKANLTVLPNVHDLPAAPPAVPTNCDRREGLVFVGSFNHPPNRQAIVMFIQDIMPRIIKHLPTRLAHRFKFHVVGSDALPHELSALFAHHQQFVHYHGYLSETDLHALMRRAKAFVAPLLSGAGVKGKVNQAMKYGLPVVGTPVAFEGMGVTHGVDGLVATTAHGFVEEVLQLYSDCVLWRRLVAGGYANLRRNFGMASARETVLRSMQSIGVPPRKHNNMPCSTYLAPWYDE